MHIPTHWSLWKYLCCSMQIHHIHNRQTTPFDWKIDNVIIIISICRGCQDTEESAMRSGLEYDLHPHIVSNQSSISLSIGMSCTVGELIFRLWVLTGLGGRHADCERIGNRIEGIEVHISRELSTKNWAHNVRIITAFISLSVFQKRKRNKSRTRVIAIATIQSVRVRKLWKARRSESVGQIECWWKHEAPVEMGLKESVYAKFNLERRSNRGLNEVFPFRNAPSSSYFMLW